MKMKRLAIVATHPVQYFSPIFRYLSAFPHLLEVKCYFACLQGAHYSSIDPYFGVNVNWDCDVLSGYSYYASTRGDIAEAKGVKGFFSALRSLVSILQNKPDYVLIFAYSPSYITVLTIFLMLFRIPLLLRADTSEPAYFRHPIKSFIRKHCLALYYKNFDHIFPIGAESFKHYLTHNVKPSSLTTVPYAVDTDVIRPSSFATHDPKGRLRIGYIGKFTPEKDPLTIIKAIYMLEDCDQERLTLSFVGNGILLPALKRSARRIHCETEFKGFMNQKDLDHFYSSLDVLILPSVEAEVWGLVVNEALSKGLHLIVSTNVASRHDLIRNNENGSVFMLGSSRSLSHEIKKLLIRWPWPRVPSCTPSPKDFANTALSYLCQNS